jgi:hypothetical protein
MRKLVIVCALLTASLPGLVVLAQVPRTAIDTAGAATVYIETDRGSGSGFLFSSDGYILTCNHVIDKATTIQVYISGGRQLPGRLVQAAPEIDAAVLKIDATVQTYLSLGDSATASYGDEVAAIGYPARVFTVTTGTVSAFPNLGQTQIMQVTAAINPGNSGGPLIRYSGEVIGIIFAAADADEYLRQYGFVPQAMNYAIPINLVKERFGLAAEDWRVSIAGTLVFQEDFGSVGTAWSTGSDLGLLSGIFADKVMSERSLHMIVAGSDRYYWLGLPVNAPHDFVLEMDVRSVSASPGQPEGYGVIFRKRGDSFIAARVWTDGTFSGAFFEEATWSRDLLGAAGRSAAIKQNREVNHVRLIAVGSQFVFEINGVQVFDVRDDTIPDGFDIALAVSTPVGAFAYAHVAFSNIRLYALP